MALFSSSPLSSFEFTASPAALLTGGPAHCALLPHTCYERWLQKERLAGLVLPFEGLSGQKVAHLRTETKKNASVAAIDKLERVAGVATTHR